MSEAETVQQGISPGIHRACSDHCFLCAIGGKLLGYSNTVTQDRYIAEWRWCQSERQTGAS